MSFWVKLLSGPHEGHAIRLGQGLTRIGKAEDSPLRFEYDDSLCNGGSLHVYALNGRVFIKPSDEEIVKMLDADTFVSHAADAKWIEIEGEAVVILGKTMLLIQIGEIL